MNSTPCCKKPLITKLQTMVRFLRLAASILAACSALPHVRGHTYLVEPKTSRPQKDTCSPEYGDEACCRPPPDGQGPTHGRGDKLKTAWGRNNHWGGYIRWTMLKTDELDK